MTPMEKIVDDLGQVVFRLETNFISFQRRNDPEIAAAVIRDFERLKTLKEQLFPTSTTEDLSEVWQMSRRCSDMADEADFHATHCGDEKAIQFRAAHETLMDATRQLIGIARNPPFGKARLLPKGPKP
jgi:hypothetical protein